MHRRQTLTELRHSRPPSLASLKKWSKDYSVILLGHVWEAYDLFCAEVLSKIDASQAEDDLERDITMSLERRIRKVMTGDEPYIVQHNPYEEETRKPSPAQPPQYDIAFVVNADERVMWPLEAKVLKSDSEAAVTAYANDINNEYLTCRYAPFSSEGAMVGFLMSGEENVAFNSIEVKVPCKLKHHPAFPKRPHKTSDHSRTVPPGKIYPCDFRCHHLLMRIAA